VKTEVEELLREAREAESRARVLEVRAPLARREAMRRRTRAWQLTIEESERLHEVTT